MGPKRYKLVVEHPLESAGVQQLRTIVKPTAFEIGRKWLGTISFDENVAEQVKAILRKFGIVAYTREQARRVIDHYRRDQFALTAKVPSTAMIASTSKRFEKR